MPEPITSAAAAKALAKITGDDGSSPDKLRPLTRLFGSTLDAYGEHWANKARTRLQRKNLARVLGAATRDTGRLAIEGQVNPRVADAVMDEAANCDDELMAEYLGGLLAASRTANGRDDRAITWCSMLSRMSSYQIRAHYLLYREWAVRFNGFGDLNVGLPAGADQSRMFVYMPELGMQIAPGRELNWSEAVAHCVLPLVRDQLLGTDYAVGDKATLQGLNPSIANSRFDHLVMVQASPQGLELMCWAMGQSSQLPLSGLDVDALADPGAGVPPRLVNVQLPAVEAQAGEMTVEAAAGSVLPWTVEGPEDPGTAVG